VLQEFAGLFVDDESLAIFALGILAAAAIAPLSHADRHDDGGQV
jgi:hypothetical protein